MQHKIVWLIALLVLGAMLQGASAANYGSQPEIHTYQVSVNGQMIPIIVKNGMVSIPDTPRIDRKSVFMAINEYFAELHRRASAKNAVSGSSSPESITEWYGPDFDYRERKIFSVPYQGDVYISAYAYLSIEKDQFSVVSVGGTPQELAGWSLMITGGLKVILQRRPH